MLFLFSSLFQVYSTKHPPSALCDAYLFPAVLLRQPSNLLCELGRLGAALPRPPGPPDPLP